MKACKDLLAESGAQLMDVSRKCRPSLGLGDREIQWLKSWMSAEDFEERLRRVLWSEEEVYVSIAHGDLWCNNLLMDQEKVIILDWQFVTERSPLNDIAYLMGSSMNAEERIQHEEMLIREVYIPALKEASSMSIDPSFDWVKHYHQCKESALLASVMSFDVQYINPVEKHPEAAEALWQRYLTLFQEVAQVKGCTG